MVTFFNLVYSVSAARRLLNLADDVQIQIQHFAKVVWVWVKGQRPTFISKRRFTQHFVDRRKQAAKYLRAWQVSEGVYQVVNPANAHSYQVSLTAAGPVCTCDDYTNQMQFLGRACCKHSYCCLAYLGYGSLADYLQAR